MEDKNKTAATEEEVAHLHKLITTLHTKKANSIFSLITQIESMGIDPKDTAAMVSEVVDVKQLSAMQDWVKYNKVGCSIEDNEKESALDKRLKDIKDKQARLVPTNLQDDEEYDIGIQ